MRGLEYLIYSTLSVCLLFVMIFLPLAPLFADEIPTEMTIDIESADIAHEPLIDTESVAVDIEQEPSIARPDEVPVVIDDVPPDDMETIDSRVTEVPEISDGEASPVTEVTITGTSTEEVVVVLVSNAGDEALTESSTSTRTVTDSEGTSTPEAVVIDEVIGTTTNETQVPNDDDAEIHEELFEQEGDEIVIEEQMSADVDEEITVESDELTDESVATTSTENTIVVNTLTNDENKFSFAKNECTTAGDGTFYCMKTNNVSEAIHTDRIFSAIDSEGDKEIYIEKNNEITPLTSNSYDDDAPYYDEVSNTAVWHRLIDGRYQIISFDFDTEEETQLTSDRFNNMEPNRFGSATVWQGWVGNDWEIFFFEDGELNMLTDNTTNDITPSVSGAYVVWQSFESNAWVMKVYDIRSRTTAIIDDESGGSIENPRFVLVYDSKQMTGDIETRGYDLKSGKVIALGLLPVNLPDEIPDPDQTGEERALVTTITQLKPKTEDDGGGDEPLPDVVGTSTPGDTDLFITPTVVESATTTLETVEESTATSSSDIIIPPVIAVDSADTSHIEDVIVTTYVEPIASTTLAQEMIVSEE